MNTATRTQKRYNTETMYERKITNTGHTLIWISLPVPLEKNDVQAALLLATFKALQTVVYSTKQMAS